MKTSIAVFFAIIAAVIAIRPGDAPYGMTAVWVTLAIVVGGVSLLLRRNESLMAILLMLLGLVGILGSVLFGHHFAAHH